jgi:MinD-like ATPase involved in chromosome partitioning or flagellar assembly
VDLPTYTNIWRIEKRLYKLYDFRLPMPLPVGQIAVFAAIAVPYVVVLTLLGLSFSHTLLWLYVLPPGALAWLATRPVLESKRLPELIISQARYLSEPRTWCRMAPLAEKDEITLTGRVWRRARREPATVAGPSGGAIAVAAQAAVPGATGAAAALPQATPAAAGRRAAAAARQRPAAAGRHATARAARLARPAPARWPGSGMTIGAAAAAAPASAAPLAPASAAPLAPASAAPMGPASAAPLAPASAAAPAPQPPRVSPAERPVVTVTSEPAQGRPLRVVERALSGPPASRSDGWRERVVVVPGGHRPGRPDQRQRDRARARLPVAGSRRIVVLGCTVGAGQTVTTLMTGEVLASLRTDHVAVLDLNPGTGSLADRARAAPSVTQDSALAGRVPGPAHGGDRRLAPSRLQVVAGGAAGAQAEPVPDDARKMFELVSARYALTLADPAPSAVPRVLAVADQLVLVAPASAEAASAIAMTYEWLEAHGRGGLAAAAIAVLNGVSRHTMRHVEHAEGVARGRCRAMVRVPWDDQLQRPAQQRAGPPGPAPPQRSAGAVLSPAAVHAYTALAGLLIAGLADAPELRRARI